MSPPSEPQPAHRLQPEDLAAAFEMHGEALAGVVRAIVGPGTEPTEVLQDAFLKAWHSIERGARPDDLKAWLFTLTLNQARDQRRSDQRRARHLLPMQPTQNDPTSDDSRGGLGGLLRVEALAATQAAIHSLDDGEKDVVLLRMAGDMSFRATAEALGIPESTAKSRMRQALARLRRDLHWFAPDGVDGTPAQGAKAKQNARKES